MTVENTEFAIQKNSWKIPNPPLPHFGVLVSSSKCELGVLCPPNTRPLRYRAGGLKIPTPQAV